MSDTGSAEPVQRPRLNLKPRDPNAAAKLELERQASGKVRGQRMDLLLPLLQCRVVALPRLQLLIAAVAASRPV